MYTNAIAYRTWDEVNWDEGWRLADAHDKTLHQRFPKDLGRLEMFEAEIVDLDCGGPEYRQQVLKELLTDPPAWPVAVHSYNLEDYEADELEELDIRVFRQLGPEIFDALQEMSRTRSMRHGRMQPITQ